MSHHDKRLRVPPTPKPTAFPIGIIVDVRRLFILAHRPVGL